MQRGFQLGLFLLGIQLFQEGLGNIPAVTMAVLAFNVYLYMFPAAPLLKACVNLKLVYTHREWRRLLLSPLHHVDDWHLYFNMASFVWKGIRLECRMGGGWFFYLLCVFSVLTGLVYLLLQAWLTQLMEDPQDPLVFLTHECAVGFSGVLFGLKVVNNHYDPGGVTYIWHIRVPNRFASWVELVLIYLVAPGTSLIGHLSGILVGLLYTVGPLEGVMKMCADLVSSDQNPRNSSAYFNSSGYSGTRREYHQQPDPRTYSPQSSAHRETDISGMTEEEQIDMAIRKSLNDLGKSTQRDFQLSSEEQRRLEELRINRLRRFEGVSDQRRRRL
ncbi:rhomboid-related protein 4-like [Halichoeres trimaculatus]|uniref:rhomboid-related protein 4-like n=1 Tax=Halichoeres trimaculatus TaxID=147232 RepID=UPI003D9E2FC6